MAQTRYERQKGRQNPGRKPAKELEEAKKETEAAKELGSDTHKSFCHK